MNLSLPILTFLFCLFVSFQITFGFWISLPKFFHVSSTQKYSPERSLYNQTIDSNNLQSSPSLNNIYKDKFNSLFSNISDFMNHQKQDFTSLQLKINKVSLPIEDESFLSDEQQSLWDQTFRLPSWKSLASQNMSSIRQKLSNYLYNQREKISLSSIFLTTTRKPTNEFQLSERIHDFLNLQFEIQSKSRLLETSKLITNKELNKLKTSILLQLHKLEKEGNLWLEQRIQKLDQIFKSMQINMKSTFLGNQQASTHYSLMNDLTLNRVLQMLSEADPDWKLIKSEGGINVYRKLVNSGPFSSRYACVKTNGTVKASPLHLLQLFEDNTRVKEYNTLYDHGKDIEVVADNTKISWSCSTAIFPFKPRDFCTIVHIRKLKDGTFIVLNRATNHPNAPLDDKFVRGSIIIGANVIQPDPDDPQSCVVTMITQIDPGGFAPPMLVNRLCALGPLGYMKNIQVAAHRKPSKQILQEKERIYQDINKGNQQYKWRNAKEL